MNTLGWVALVVGTIGSILASARALSTQLARFIVVATEMKEKVNLSLIGIQALREVDDGVVTRVVILERRMDDAERWLQLTSVKEEHPFVTRYRDKSGDK